MSIFKKLFTALKGGANEVGEIIVESQAIRILEQELRDADKNLRNAKDELTTMMAKRKIAQEDAGNIENRISQYESHLSALLSKEDAGTPLTSQESELKMDLATKIAELESDKADKQTQLRAWEAAEAKTSASIASTEHRITKMKQRLDSVKATESVHKAMSQVAAANSGTTSNLSTAMDSLNAVEKRQREQEKRFEASEELEKKSSGGDLDAKLKAAGMLNPSANAGSVIERMRAKK